MLQTIRDILLGIVEDIDSGNSNADEEELIMIAKAMKELVRKDIPMSKYQAYTYLGVSRATFDNMVRDGKIPPGRKVSGFKELQWYKRDLIQLKKK